MSEGSWRSSMAFVLVALSVVLFALHAVIFRDLKTLAFYLALDVVFVPVQVLFVTLILERLLEERERLSIIRKLNMVVGAFFGEVGSDFARRVGRACANSGELADRLAVDIQWTAAEFRTAARFAESCRCEFSRDRAWLAELRGFLLAKRSFVLGLLQNPNLLEHDRFTDALWAVCHLTEELEARTDPATLPDSDVDHLIADVHRAFGMLMREWLAYMRHLQDAYPYMYSLAVRANPFRPDASPLVR